MRGARLPVRNRLAVAMLVWLAGAVCACSDSGPAVAPNLPPRNPFLADSAYSIGHADSAQSDSSPIAGPSAPRGVFSAADITYQPLGPGHFGAGVSSPYPDGRRVVWSNGRENIVKLDHATFAELARYPIPGMSQTPVEDMDEALAQLDALTGQARQTLAVQLAAR